MKKFLIGFGIFVGIIIFVSLLIFGWVTGTYNNFVQLRNQVTTQWGQVETQYQRRFDLIPNLVEATRGYLIHEQKIFKEIAEARTRYAGTIGNEKVEAQGELEGVLARLLVIVENYPNLKANETVRGLMDELAGTENRVNVARQRYNETVYTYNTSLQVFPSNILAGMFQFKDKQLFVSNIEAKNAPKINLEVK